MKSKFIFKRITTYITPLLRKEIEKNPEIKTSAGFYTAMIITNLLSTTLLSYKSDSNLDIWSDVSTKYQASIYGIPIEFNLGENWFMDEHLLNAYEKTTRMAGIIDFLSPRYLSIDIDLSAGQECYFTLSIKINIKSGACFIKGSSK